MENFENTRQTNYTIAECYELPSRGMIYSEHVNPKIELRSMTGRDEMKRTSPSTTQFKVLADIIDGCMIEKCGISAYDMALPDYEFLLHKLRIVSYGPDYKMLVGCPHCGEDFEAMANLENLAIKEIDMEEYNKLRTVKLPKSGHTITLAFQTPRSLDEQATRVKDLKRQFKNAELDFGLLASIAACVDEVDGTKFNQLKLESFIENLPVADMTKIINQSDKLNRCFGINGQITLDCEHCGGEVITFFRIGQEFFRPTHI